MKNTLKHKKQAVEENSLLKRRGLAPATGGAPPIQVETTQDLVNMAADRGCCISACSASLLFSLR
jgi:hypothetical protein